MMESPRFEKFIAFDPNKCTQCMGCQNACKSWRQLPYGIQHRRVLNLWHDNGFPDVKNSSLSLGCLHCVSPACLEACPVEAIMKGTDGLVTVDSELCIGCEACQEACPYDVPQFDENDIMIKCDLCSGLLPREPELPPPCIATCPNGALSLISGTTAEKLLQQELISRILSK